MENCFVFFNNKRRALYWCYWYQSRDFLKAKIFKYVLVFLSFMLYVIYVFFLLFSLHKLLNKKIFILHSELLASSLLKPLS